MKELRFFDSMQHIYELQLARMELESLGASYRCSDEFDKFYLLNDDDVVVDRVRKRSGMFEFIDDLPTDYGTIIRRSYIPTMNCHLLHFIYPYKGKFHPQLVRTLLNILKLQEGEVVLDPFIGSGTTALESQILGIKCIGFDISPFCILLSKVKSNLVHVFDKIKSYENEFGRFAVKDRDEFRLLISQISDQDVQDFLWIVRMNALSDATKRGKKYSKSFMENLNKIIASVEAYRCVASELGLNLSVSDIQLGDARHLPLADNSVDGILTSPPYSVALDYVQNDEHALVDLGYDTEELRNQVMGVRGKGLKQQIANYNEDMASSISEMYRVLKSGRYAVIVIGDATRQGKRIETTKFVMEVSEKCGLKLVKNIRKSVRNAYNTIRNTIRVENILIFQK